MNSAKKWKKTIEWDKLEISEKIGYAKGTFQTKMGTVKDRNGKDLTEAEEIKRWQEYTEELYKKGLHDSDNDDSAVTQLEPDIPKSEVK